jgi:tetratricopeptide (TPR) repeat protein
MKLIHLTAIMLILPAFIISGQSDVTVSKREFKIDKPGFDAAWQHVKDGDSFYSKGGVWYSNAMIEYRAAYLYNSKNAELNYKLGVSCLYSDNKEISYEYLLKALAQKPGVSNDILLLTGRALQYAGQYNEAVKKLEEYLASPLKKTTGNIERANRYISECKSAASFLIDTLRFEIRNIGAEINSSADEYAEVISRNGEKMFFASRRADSDKPKNLYNDTKSDENIYRSDFENGKWSISSLAGKNLKTDFCETPLDIDPTGTILYIYAGYEGNGDIMVAEFKKGEWRSPGRESFGVNSSEPETSFSISPSGNEIAFISDRGKKGLGGKDVYFMYKNNRKWSKPVNAGVNINSGSNEESVRFSRGGDTLWFSSSGHNTIGGFDIFFSIRKGGGGWSAAVNAGGPINTQWNEFFYFPSPVNDSLFYFASDRSGGFGGLDIYTGKLRQTVPLKTVLPAELSGTKVDSVPKAPVQVSDTVSISDTTLIRKTIMK